MNRLTRHGWFPFALLGLVAAGCGGDGTSEPTLPLMEAMIIHPDDIDWEFVLEAREALGASATEFPFSSYGEQRDNSPNRDPQVSYLVPVGTPVYAPVSGRVVVVGELYSGDLGIQIGAADQTQLVPVWEVEHVVDVLVEEGDMVVAGQRVGTASDAFCDINPVYCEYDIAVVELGLLTSAGHECPFAPSRLSPAHATALEAELDGMFATLRDLLEDPSAFDHSEWETSQCLTLDIVDPR